MDQLERIARVYEIESKAVARAYRAIDMQQFDTAVRRLLHAQRIAACGCGHSGFSCMHFVHLMCCIERPARFLYPSEALHGGIGFLLSGDVMLLCSIAGRTSELLAVEEVCRRKRVHVIAVTEDISSPLARRADTVLRLAITHEADKFESQGTTSFTVANVLFDALQNALIDKVGFTQAQYALDHPGGAIGEQLNKQPLFDVNSMSEPSD